MLEALQREEVRLGLLFLIYGKVLGKIKGWAKTDPKINITLTNMGKLL